ncbi:alpha/beta hydrolase [Solihabitans fulvus]|uniref:Alpha/beta hydrolase n=1 Tax=Solihabitans fulvus TaxID=1892852 RepID=A0A5B2XEL4_9PSEU|nr:alpha/beta hydrolase [Solihabitans fulvus]KAA2261485.1 alpha/beta hydrolase [Solihabitans fulvus]
MLKAVSKDGTTLAYDQLGDGPAVLIVGGAFTDRRATRPLADLLAADFTVLNYDRRGRGDSGDTAPFAVEREIEDIAALIEQAGGAAAVFAHSSGAALAIEAARALPGITQLALYEPPFIVDDSRPPLPGDYVAHLQELTAAGKREEIVEYFMTVAVGLPAEFLAPMRDGEMWPHMIALAPTVAYDGAAVAANMMGRPLPSEWSGEITVPTLVLDGENSPAWQRDSVQALVNLLPDAQRHSLPGADHGAPPEQLAPVLTAFLR